MKQPTSMRLSDMTHRQLEELISSTGLTQSEVVSQAIDRMYQQEAIMTAKTYSRRQHIIQKIAERIRSAQWDDEQLAAANRYGFTIDIRFQDGEYIGDSWSQVSDIHLDPQELEEAKRIAASF